MEVSMKAAGAVLMVMAGGRLYRIEHDDSLYRTSTR
jgi:hypothetical protein